MVINDYRFLKSLTYDQLQAVMEGILEVCEEHELETEETFIASTLQKLEETHGASRKNEYVAQQQDLLAMMRDEVKMLKAELRYTYGESETAALDVFNKTLKKAGRLGMYRFVGQVAYFLGGLGDLEFDGAIASRISTLRILMSRFASVDHDKLNVKRDRKLAKKAYDYRDDLQQHLAQVAAKLVVKDLGKENGNALASFNSLLEHFRAIFVRREADTTEPSDDGGVNTDSDAQG